MAHFSAISRLHELKIHHVFEVAILYFKNCAEVGQIFNVSHEKDSSNSTSYSLFNIKVFISQIKEKNF
jgi:hypothetical protein